MRGIPSFALFLWIALSTTAWDTRVVTAESSGARSGDASVSLGSDAGGWAFPGEYESHQAMWMMWPTYENKAGFPSSEPMSDMIRAP